MNEEPEEYPDGDEWDSVTVEAEMPEDSFKEPESWDGEH